MAAATAAAPLDENTTKLVLRQVEFYFSDSNLPRDNFLRKTVQESEDGLVSLALICAFSRMRKHLGLGEIKPEEIPEEKLEAVAEVLRTSPALKVSEDGKKIGRSSELLKPEEIAEQVDSRTVAVSPLPHDVKIEDLESFFGQQGTVNSVRLPRHIGDKRLFCGTALIEFSVDEDAEKVLKESLVYAGAELHVKSKSDFDAERVKSREDFERTRNNKNSSDGSYYEKGLIIAFKLKAVGKEGDSEQSQTEDPKSTGTVQNGEQETLESDKKDDKPSADVANVIEEKEDKPSAAADAANVIEEKEDKPSADAKNGKEKMDIESDPGKAEQKDANCSAEASNVSEETKDGVVKGSTDESKGKIAVTREDLRLVFQKYGNVKYIDFQMGQESGYVRFDTPEAAVKARAVAAINDLGGLAVKNFIATIEALTGDAEKDYWNALKGFQDKRRENFNSRGRGGRNNRGRGGRHFDGKRRSDSNDGRSNKFQKLSTDE